MAPRVRAAAKAAAPETVLPVGNAPAPVPLPHFPSRLHAFIWRNWPLVPAERLAKVVGATRGQIEDTARAMGLGRQPLITAEQQRRSYISIIKRNWHLLPYEQLLVLLDWTPEKLAFTLREDDFLFIKLGNHKPKCEPLRWVASPNKATSVREEEIGRTVRETFGEEVHSKERLFHFVDDLSEKPWFAEKPEPGGALRLCYSYFALYGDPLLEPGLDPYPDGYLMQLAESGVNAVWLQAVLHKLAPFPWQRDLSDRYEERIRNLGLLVARAKRRGISIYLYLNEPRSLPQRFFDAHPQLKGVSEGDHATLCTSVPEVQRWMRDAVAQICAAVPDLGGFFTITASENLTNCWSHGGGAKCLRCSKEQPASVIAKVNRAVQEGIERARSRAKDPTRAPQLMAWDWGWNDAWAPEIIRQLPKECSLMSVSEWNLPIERGGVKTVVGEYSISAIGPGPRAQRHWTLARERGLKVIAKIQANVSWELSAVPYIPAVQNVAEHVARLSGKVDGVMLGWTLGGHPSPNLDAIVALGELARANGPTRTPDELAQSAVVNVARRRFGKTAHQEMAHVWRDLSEAFREFPYHIGVVYSGPQQLGPANLLFEQSTGYRATMVGFPYDDLDQWRAVYPVNIFIRQFEKVANGFREAIGRIKALQRQKMKSGQRDALASELRVTEACEIHFRSVANQARFVRARRALSAAKTSAEAVAPIDELENVLREEIQLARRLHAIQRVDARMGFEATNQYYYVPVDLVEKVLNCQDLLNRWLPAERTKRK
jgi:hypothetical protein